MEYIIIANPHSGGGMGNKQFDLLIQYCKTQNLSYVSYLTQYGGEVYQIIKKLLPTYMLIIVSLLSVVMEH